MLPPLHPACHGGLAKEEEEKRRRRRRREGGREVEGGRGGGGGEVENGRGGSGGVRMGEEGAPEEVQNSILQAGKDSSCMTTVLLEASTMMLSSCCFSWVCWYHSRVTSVSWVGIRVT